MPGGVAGAQPIMAAPYADRVCWPSQQGAGHFLRDTASDSLQGTALENHMHHHPFTHRSSSPAWLLAVLATLAVWSAQAQSEIYRCGTEYTNNPTPEQKKTCKAIDGGNITVIPASKPKAGAPKSAAPVPVSGDQPKVDPAVQKARDSDARAILEAELRRGEQRLSDLQREYNGGQPERRGEEVRNQMRYTERVSGLKDSIARAEADLVGIRRELSRATGGNANAGNNTQAQR